MIITLTRYGSTPQGTFGEIWLGNRKFYTVERPWLDNQPYKSCVPLGDYKLLWKATSTSVPNEYDGHTWYLDGETVASGWSGKPRTRCCLHIANTQMDVNGCIGVGKQLGTRNAQWAIKSSRIALVELLEQIKGEDHELVIRQGGML